MASEEASGLTAFFLEVSRLIEQAERQYGLANRSYTEYIIERLEYSITVCSDLCDHMVGVSGLEDYCRSAQQLIDCIKVICRKWEDYEAVLDSYMTERPSVAYQTPATVSHVGPGRPRFDITKEQLEYLSSLSFKWNQIAALLGVSRMTIYRYILYFSLQMSMELDTMRASCFCRRRLEYGMTTDPNTEVSDEELTSTIKLIRQDAPYSGVSMMWGSLRARGIRVTRERVRSTLHNVDPLSAALRWPAGATKRRPYSVAGPNSLWHIGIQCAQVLLYL